MSHSQRGEVMQTDGQEDGHAAPPAKAGVGSAVNDITREVGGALGIAALGSIVSVLYRNDIEATAALPGNVGTAFEESIGAAAAATTGSVGALDTAREAFTSAIGTAFMLCAIVMALTALAYLVPHRRARRITSVPAPVGAGDGDTTPDSECARVPCAR